MSILSILSILTTFVKNWRFWAGIGAVCIVLGLGWYLHHKGYQACKVDYEAAQIKAQNEARTKIIGVEKKYEPIKTKIIQDKSPNAPVGHRVELAIDSLPEPSAN